jgi:hypothetical protein
MTTPRPATLGQLAALGDQVIESDLMTDEFLTWLTLRVIALEEVAAARWPRRLLVAARLGRLLRRSVRDIEDGPDLTGFRLRRVEDAATAWDRAALWPRSMAGEHPHRHRHLAA